MTGVRRFRSMGCEVVVGGACISELEQIEGLFDERDRTFSRFQDDSELARVNRLAGRDVLVSRPFARTLGTALQVAALTDGLVDPTLGRALEAAGYDRDFALLEPDPRPTGGAARGAWRNVRLVGQLLRVPGDVHLDLNGVVKAMTVDDALALISGDGFVSAGGDLATRGPLDVALPGEDAVRLVRGSLATSGSAHRRWLRGGRLQHHLIDPATGLPADPPWEQVTVSGRTCLDADVAAKAAFLLGADGPSWLDEHRLPGRFLRASGDVVCNHTWRASVPEVLACT